MDPEKHLLVLMSVLYLIIHVYFGVNLASSVFLFLFLFFLFCRNSFLFFNYSYLLGLMHWLVYVKSRKKLLKFKLLGELFEVHNAAFWKILILVSSLRMKPFYYPNRPLGFFFQWPTLSLTTGYKRSVLVCFVISVFDLNEQCKWNCYRVFLKFMLKNLFAYFGSSVFVFIELHKFFSHMFHLVIQWFIDWRGVNLFGIDGSGEAFYSVYEHVIVVIYLTIYVNSA